MGWVLSPSPEAPSFLAIQQQQQRKQKHGRSRSWLLYGRLPALGAVSAAAAIVAAAALVSRMHVRIALQLA